jgi:hypothetical protein
MIPSAETFDKIVKAAAPVDAFDFIADPHATIIYSPDIVDIKTMELPKVRFPIVGTSPKFQVFATKDDGLCLVLAFDCDTAEILHKEISARYNLRTLYYENYVPHMTIKKRLSEDVQMPALRFDLLFDAVIFGNGRGH